MNQSDASQSSPLSFGTFLSVGHDDPIPFLRQYYLRELTWVVVSHSFFTILCIGLWVGEGIDGGIGVRGAMTTLGWILAGFVVSVLMHELVHGIVHAVLGARDIRLRTASWKTIAIVIAHRHVTSAAEFTWVRMSPFLAVTAVVAVIIGSFPPLTFIMLGILTLHTAACAGDWALLNVVWLHRDREFYIYDDSEEGVTRFVTPGP